MSSPSSKKEKGIWPDTKVGYSRLREEDDEEVPPIHPSQQQNSKHPSKHEEKVEKKDELSFAEQGYDRGFGHGKKN